MLGFVRETGNKDQQRAFIEERRCLRAEASFRIIVNCMVNWNCFGTSGTEMHPNAFRPGPWHICGPAGRLLPTGAARAGDDRVAVGLLQLLRAGSRADQKCTKCTLL